MTSRQIASAASVLAVFMIVLSLSGDEAAPPKEASRPAILVELFTSQGCSSCPPADALLSRLGQDKRVVPLAFHVDYWNSIGWRDPFSSPEWSRRQQEYARRLWPGRVYTPQMLIGGATEVVGNQNADVQRAITRLARQPATAEVKVIPTVRGQQLSLMIDATTDRSATLLVAVYQNHATTRVSRGENRGRVLRNDFVVRRLENVALLPSGRKQIETSLSLASDWNHGALGVAVFLQEPKTLQVLAATSAALY